MFNSIHILDQRIAISRGLKCTQHSRRGLIVGIEVKKSRLVSRLLASARGDTMYLYDTRYVEAQCEPNQLPGILPNKIFVFVW
jgi:hypothetical protein